MYDKAAPLLYRSIALFFFYVLKLNRDDKNREKISGDDIARCVNGGARYFLGGQEGRGPYLAEWRVRSFATRKSELPDSRAEFLELARVASLLYEADDALQNDRFIAELLSAPTGFDFPKAYKHLRRGDIAGATKIIADAKRLASGESFHARLAQELGITAEDGRYLRRVLLRRAGDGDPTPAALSGQAFQTYRLSSTSGDVVVSSVEVSDIVSSTGDTVREFLGFKTISSDRDRLRNSTGFVFLVPQTGVYFVGSVEGGMGLNFAVLPLPLSADDETFSGLVVTPDNRRTGRPVASRIEFVRCAAPPPRQSIGIHARSKIPDAVLRNIENKVDFNLRRPIVVNNTRIFRYDDLANEVSIILQEAAWRTEEHLGEDERRGRLLGSPLSRFTESEGVEDELNPLDKANFIFDAALGSAKEDT